MGKKFFIETFGCQMNDLDSEKIAGNLNSSGMEPVLDPSEADVIILNTCSVREKAVQKVYARLGELKRHRMRRKDLVVGVVGCMAQLEGEKIIKRAPFVNLLAGPQKGHIMSELVEQSMGASSALVQLRTDENEVPAESGYILRQCSWRACVTVSEGCNRQCAFCVVPTTRGRERVRPAANILREVEDLVATGYVEILLLGQTVNSYVDRSNGAPVTFAGLLKRMSRFEGLKRIRFTSPHPCDFSDELLEAMADCPQVCNQIHLPVQSGSTRVLKRMRRGYTRETYLEVIRKIKALPRNVAISTDLIAGFPGETESDFQDTLSLLNAVQYDSAFSFKYSRRPNTAAESFADEVPEQEKGRRLKQLQDSQREIQYRKLGTCVGRSLEVLVEDRARTRFSLSGRTTDNKIVNFDGPDNLMGRFVQVEITGFGPNSLKGILTQSENMGQSGAA
jgi:tRNA-2-methylthio-N6-dimethylallyladenosine synthase